MIINGTRMVAAWLAHETYGVNALLPDVPKDQSDAQPPDVAVIQNEFDQISVALREVPENQTTPALWLLTHERVAMDGGVTTEFRKCDHPLVIGYLQKKQQSHIGLRDANITLRAVTWSLAALQKQGSSERTRNNIALETIKAIDQLPPFTPMEDGVLTAGLIVSLALRDMQAQPQ